MITPGRYVVRAGEEVRVASIGGDGRVVVEGEPVPFDVARAAPGTYRVSDGLRTSEVFVAGPPDRRQVFFDGEVYELQVSPDGATPASAAADGDAMSAPMPATVTRVHVTPGQAVRRGEIVVTLEAMKMEMPIRAPRDGSVKRVHCSPGQLVLPGAPLLEIA